MPAGRNNASSLLQKVNSQLKGERVPIKSKEEDELAIYLQKLSQKTQEAKNIGFEEHGDISISSGADALQTPRGRRSASPAESGIKASGSSSKFLKKKKSIGARKGESNEEDDHYGKEVIIHGKKKSEPVSKPSVLHPVRTSALEKASALANKITNRAGGIPLRRHRSGGSDSEESLRGSDFGKRPGSAGSVGHDENRFLKSRRTVSEEPRQDTRSPSPQLRHQNVSLEKKESPRKSSKTRGEIVRTLGNMYLTSEEESLAEFIHGLSTSETSKKPQNLVAKKQQKWRKKGPSSSGRQSASPIHMSRSSSPFKNRSPSPFKHMSRSVSQDSDMLDSIASEMMEDRNRQDDSISSDDNKFNVNLMDIASLMPAAGNPEMGRKSGKKKPKRSSTNKKSSSGTSTSVFKASVPNIFKADSLTDSPVSKKKTQKAESKSNLFESLGIQMADDLFDDIESVKDEKEYGGDNSVSESEIVTEKSQDRHKSFKRMDSDSEIKTELGRSKSKKVPLERQSSVEDSISERLNDRPSFGNIKLAYSSEEEEGVETEADYTESFISESETSTVSPGPKSRQKRKQKEDSYSRGSRSSTRRRRERKVVMEEKRVDISAADDQGKTHYWNATQMEISVSGPFGLQYVDPTPIATHVVSADALEAMTAYNPNMLALQDMMKSQLQLISSFMDIQRRIYHSCINGLHEDHHYTTLQDTKEFIHKSRKPRMSMEEALMLVDLEDGVTR